MIKYKITELAKDLNVKPKDIINLMKNYEAEGSKKKNSQSSLNEDELNFVFDHYTKQSVVDDLDSYLSEKKTEVKESKTQDTTKSVPTAPAAAAPSAEPKEPKKAESTTKENVQPAKTEKRDIPAAGKADTQVKEVKEVKTDNVNKPLKDTKSSDNVRAEKDARPNRDKAQQRDARPQRDNKQPNDNKKKPFQNSEKQPFAGGDNKDKAKAQDNRKKNDRPAEKSQNNGDSKDKFKPRNEAKSNTEKFNEKIKNAEAQKEKSKNDNKKKSDDKANKTARRDGQTLLTKDNASFGDFYDADRDTGSRVINTRTVDINIDKYNEKYDDMASQKMRSDSTVSKQKINQKSQRKGKPKNSRKDFEQQERMNRQEQERKKKPLTVVLPDEIVVSDLAMKLRVTTAEVVKKLVLMGVMAGQNQVIDFDTAGLVAMEFNAIVEHEKVVTIEERIIDDSEDKDENLVERAPIVVVMGHVDHGKTSLLDAIREENVTATEAGGITQHIGAYRARINDKEITFLDTPGHEAFTTMRARGAQVTDIAILVVAADDGIMPQTIEAINHAKDAGVSIIVAINKIDKEGADVQRVMQQLTEYSIVPEEWGGDTPCIPVSAKKKQNIDDLLEMVLLVAEMKELKANPDRAAKGTVIEARLDKGRGPVATMLVQNGTLKIGDIVVAGSTVGRVRAMTDYKGKKVKSAGPSYPVEITGLDDVPTGGDVFNVVSDERLARELVEQRKTKAKEELFNAQKPNLVTLDNLFDQMQQGEVKELKVIVKADVQGSVEAVRQSLEKLSNDEVKVRVIHGAVGGISENDVNFASASGAIVVGFNVRPDPVAEENAKRDGVDIRCYRIIYDCIEEIESAMKGMLAPKTREVVLGRAECRNVIKVKNVGFIAGSYVLTGKVARNSQVRVVRDGIVIFEDTMSSLQRFKDSVKEVSAGFECGIGLEKFGDIKEGDILESFIIEEYRD
ncbi:MAG: translation initiation factor IF-2 [Acutalibacteraceae bacterium]|nr:translation initiation factor IF-2 [Acutalibacteraceae bacterium]